MGITTRGFWRGNEQLIGLTCDTSNTYTSPKTFLTFHWPVIGRVTQPIYCGLRSFKSHRVTQQKAHTPGLLFVIDPTRIRFWALEWRVLQLNQARISEALSERGFRISLWPQSASRKPETKTSEHRQVSTRPCLECEHIACTVSTFCFKSPLSFFRRPVCQPCIVLVSTGIRNPHSRKLSRRTPTPGLEDADSQTNECLKTF